MEPVRTLQAGELVEQLDDGSFRVVQQSQPSLYQDGNENNKLDSMAIQEFNPPGMVPSQPMQIIQQGKKRTVAPFLMKAVSSSSIQGHNSCQEPQLDPCPWERFMDRHLKSLVDR